MISVVIWNGWTNRLNCNLTTACCKLRSLKQASLRTRSFLASEEGREGCPSMYRTYLWKLDWKKNPHTWKFYLVNDTYFLRSFLAHLAWFSFLKCVKTGKAKVWLQIPLVTLSLGPVPVVCHTQMKVTSVMIFYR